MEISLKDEWEAWKLEVEYEHEDIALKSVEITQDYVVFEIGED